jgi:hypothetical protein
VGPGWKHSLKNKSRTFEINPGTQHPDERQLVEATKAAYADIVVAENMFANLALQARLHKKYNTQITTDLMELPSKLSAV